METLFRSATEPAIQKALIYATLLAGLPGNPSLYVRDILGGMGYEEKAKNVYLQNRNTVKWSELEEGPLKEYRQRIFDMFKDVMKIRSTEGMDALNNGTPYPIGTSNPDVPAMLYQNGYGDTVISVFNLLGIDPENRVRYHIDRNKAGNDIQSINNDNPYVPVQEKLELDSIILPAGLAIAEGTIFVNMLKGDEAKYEVRFIDGLYRLVNKTGKIAMNGVTAKNGVMFLKKLKPAFRGKNSYHACNLYAKKENADLGQNLSIISK